MTSPRTRATRDRQQAVLYAISVHWKQHGYAPTLREIQALTGMSSTSVVKWHVERLRAAGLIEYVDNTSRTIRLKSA